MDNKFIKVKEYIQGMDQLTFQTDYLVICSSLKDMMTLMSMGISNVECIAPDSENTLISEHVIQSLKGKYKSVCTLFDNDKAGIEAMEKYKAKYGLANVHLTLEKDLSDAVAAHKMDVVREKLIPLLKQNLVNELAL
jgi:DNA primase